MLFAKNLCRSLIQILLIMLTMDTVSDISTAASLISKKTFSGLPFGHFHLIELYRMYLIFLFTFSQMSLSGTDILKTI